MTTTRKCLRWSDDTRTAFVLGLRLTGTVTGAAAAIGRQRAVCRKARAGHPDFAAAWDAALAESAELDAAGDPPPTDGRGKAVLAGSRRRDGFGEVKRRAFLRALSGSGTVDGACRRAGVSGSALDCRASCGRSQ